MSQKLVISGASGYVGSRLVELALQRGVAVAAIGSTPIKGATLQCWWLGEPPPPPAFIGVSAVIHLAHSWASDEERGVSEQNRNLSGAESLFEAACSAGILRFVFASSVAARPDSLNVYGRVKYAIEQKLTGMRHPATSLVCSRIGTVYGGPERGFYGLLCRIVRMSPVLPVIGRDLEIQPIHVDEVCEGLLTLALDPRQGHAEASRIVVMASPRPITFGDWIKLLRRAQTGRGTLLVPMPQRLAMLCSDISAMVPFGPTISRERILGILNARAIDSAADLESIGLTIADPSERLGLGRWRRRQMISEAAALLSFVQGRRCRSPRAIKLLVRGIERLGGRPLDLPGIVLRCPGWLRIFEPVGINWKHALGQRLHLAALVLEGTMPAERTRRLNPYRFVVEMLLELASLPVRLLLGRLYA